MKFSDSFSLGDLNRLLQAVDASLSVRSHLELLKWLQLSVQEMLPHDIVIAAWGDFSLGLVSYDVVSPLPGLRTDDLDDGALLPMVVELFTYWKQCNHAPCAVVGSYGFSSHIRSNHELVDTLRCMPSALVHGIKDQRGRHDCLYIFLGPEPLGEPKSCNLLRYLLPYVDAAFRQVAHLPAQYLQAAQTASAAPATLLANPGASAEADTLANDELGLSSREQDIMEWVRAGKTNQEIGMILDISAFTVKNHVKRIFKKLNVVNRAQAVSKMADLSASARR
ncbi:MAG: transcriptional regulator EpsA [Serpentinimonas sp.]|nr:transcriptional regulator EpsA [Serpentinimonas sp.]